MGVETTGGGAVTVSAAIELIAVGISQTIVIAHLMTVGIAVIAAAVADGTAAATQWH